MYSTVGQCGCLPGEARESPALPSRGSWVKPGLIMELALAWGLLGPLCCSWQMVVVYLRPRGAADRHVYRYKYKLMRQIRMCKDLEAPYLLSL